MLGKNEATVHCWCTNESQSSLETLVKIANALKVDVKDLLISTIRKKKFKNRGYGYS